MKIVVVVPTYNEADNIGRLIEALSKVFPLISNHEMHLLVVDSNSPDGTSQVVRDASQKYPWVHLFVEPSKNGIGAAYFLGFKYAMNELKAEAVVEMDADFQHNPEELPVLIEPLDKGYDYIIGSRFVKGGSIPKNWAFYRKFLSIGGSIFTKVVLGMYKVNDFSTGFKVSRVKGFLDQINLNEIRSGGFSYKTELLYRMHKLGARIIEVPITFGLRDRGNSKMEVDNFMDSLITVVMLRVKEKKEFFKFGMVGGVGFVVDSGIFNILSLGILAPKIAALVSGALAMTTTFLLNNTWSFKERKKTDQLDIAKNIVVYFVVSTVPIVVRSKIVALFDLWYGHNFWIYNTAFIIGVILGLIWNYFIYSRVIWSRNKKKPI